MYNILEKVFFGDTLVLKFRNIQFWNDLIIGGVKYMYEQDYITKAQQEEALADDVYDRIQNVDTATKGINSHYSYFTDELIEQVISALMEKLDYTESQASNLLYSGGLQIYTTQDQHIQSILDEEYANPETYP